MSQIYKSGSGGGGVIPPTVPESFVTDVNSPAIPAANILDVVGGTSTSNNTNGIQTDGSSGSNILTVQLTNRLSGSGTTTGAATTNLVTFALGASAGVYVIEANIAGFNSATPAGCGFSLFGTIRTDGATATLVGIPDKIQNREAALTSTDANITASGNNAIISVTGQIGLNLDWITVAYYVKVT